MRRLIIATLIAVPTLLSGCGQDDKPATTDVRVAKVPSRTDVNAYAARALNRPVSRLAAAGAIGGVELGMNYTQARAALTAAGFTVGNPCPECFGKPLDALAYEQRGEPVPPMLSDPRGVSRPIVRIDGVRGDTKVKVDLRTLRGPSAVERVTMTGRSLRRAAGSAPGLVKPPRGTPVHKGMTISWGGGKNGCTPDARTPCLYGSLEGKGETLVLSDGGYALQLQNDDLSGRPVGSPRS